MLALPRLHPLPAVDRLPRADRRHDDIQGRGTTFGRIDSSRLLGQGDSRHPAARVALQGLGRDGEPPLLESHGGSDGMQLDDLGEADAAVDAGAVRLQDPTARLQHDDFCHFKQLIKPLKASFLMSESY